MTLSDFWNFDAPNRRTAFFMSIVLGAALTVLWSELIHAILRRQFPNRPKPSRVRWMPMASGVFERALATAFVIWIPAAVGPFMGTWIVAKAAGGWAFVVKPAENTHADDYQKALYFAGLLGSVVSLGWAIAWGLWAPPGHR